MTKSHLLEILYEDEWIIVVNKPAGMLSVGYPGYRGKSAQDILTDMYRSRGSRHIAIVHRLDRDTSGIMLFARSAEAKKRFMDDWQEIVTERLYRVVCLHDGTAPLPDNGTIDAPLAYNRYDVAFVPRGTPRSTAQTQKRNSSRKTEAHAKYHEEKAITHFRVIERGDLYDLVECELETGRKNQIRAHLAWLGHPVVGDQAYGLSEDGPIDRLALHARVLAFTHPFTGTPHRFEVPEPESFKKLVATKKTIPHDTHHRKKRTADSGNDTFVLTQRRQKQGKNGSKYIPE